MPKRLGLVLASTPAYSETFFRNKIKGLQQNGIQVILFVGHIDSNWDQLCPVVELPSFKNFRITVKNIIRINYLLVTQFRKAYFFFRLSRKEKIEWSKSIKNTLLNAVFFNQQLDWISYGFGTLAIDKELVAETIGAKMAVSFRGFDIYIYPLKHPKCYDLLFKKEVRYHVLSDEMKTTLINKNINYENIFKITPAIDIDLFSASIKKKDSEKINLVTIARLHWIKGIEYTLESLAIIKKMGYDFNYSIIGDGIEKERLIFATHQLGLVENVQFLGRKNQTEIVNILKQSDIYIQYSLQEGFSNATLEAQAMGLICVVSDADGLAENVLDNITGFVVKKREPSELATKLHYILTLSEDVVNQIKNAAIERVRNNFNINKQISEFMCFYEFKE